MADTHCNYFVVVIVRVGTLDRLCAGCMGVEYSYIVVAFFAIAVAVAGCTRRRVESSCLQFEPDRY
jgi:hypothetical protein